MARANDSNSQCFRVTHLRRVDSCWFILERCVRSRLTFSSSEPRRCAAPTCPALLLALLCTRYDCLKLARCKLALRVTAWIQCETFSPMLMRAAQLDAPAFEFALDTDANLYRFEYSGGIADTPFTAVPESGAAFAMFGTVLLAGVSMRRAIRRRQQNSA